MFNLAKAEYSHAIIIPHDIKDLGRLQNRTRNGYGYIQESSSYATASGVILSHHSNYGPTAAFLELFGIGIIPLSAMLFVEQTHTTFYGRELHRALKIKALIIASSDKYVAGNDPLVITKKVKSDREKLYKESSKTFNKFCNKLKIEYTEDQIKQLIYRANTTGLLYAKSLRKAMNESDSFRPLRWLIESGQLEDRIQQIEAIIAEREEKIDKIHNKITEDGALNELLPRTELLKSNLTDGIYPLLREKILAIEDFSFEYIKEKYNDYEKV